MERRGFLKFLGMASVAPSVAKEIIPKPKQPKGLPRLIKAVKDLGTATHTITLKVRKFAAEFRVSDEIMEDCDDLDAVIRSQFVQAMMKAEEDAILNGMKMNRRGFLKFLGVTGTAIIAPPLTKHVIPKIDQPLDDPLELAMTMQQVAVPSDVSSFKLGEGALLLHDRFGIATIDMTMNVENQYHTFGPGNMMSLDGKEMGKVSRSSYLVSVKRYVEFMTDFDGLQSLMNYVDMFEPESRFFTVKIQNKVYKFYAFGIGEIRTEVSLGIIRMSLVSYHRGGADNPILTVTMEK